MLPVAITSHQWPGLYHNATPQHFFGSATATSRTTLERIAAESRTRAAFAFVHAIYSIDFEKSPRSGVFTHVSDLSETSTPQARPSRHNAEESSTSRRLMMWRTAGIMQDRYCVLRLARRGCGMTLKAVASITPSPSGVGTCTRIGTITRVSAIGTSHVSISR